MREVINDSVIYTGSAANVVLNVRAHLNSGVNYLRERHVGFG